MSEKHTNVLSVADASERLLEGLNMTANAVGCTLGPKGKTVLIQVDDRATVTKDGVTVSKSINPRDPLHLLGARLVQEAASRTNEVAGDGTTTATILTQTFVNECAKYVASNQSAFSIKNGINAGVKHVLSNLFKNKKFISSNVEVENIATISANGSTNIGNLIATAINKVTRNGVVTIEDAKGMNTSVEVVEGMQIDRGYISSYFVNNKEKMIAFYENCRVLVTTEKLSEMSDIIGILNETISAREPLLIIADDIDGTAMQTLLLNRAKQQISVVAIRSPGYGASRIDYLNDICALTGAKLLGSETGTPTKKSTKNDLGTCQKIIVTRNNTTFVGGKGTDLNKYVENLKTQLSDITLSIDILQLLRIRIASLVNGIAIIRVGGATELEMNERKDRVEDALNATRAAMEEGIVPGGGVALLKASKDVLKIVSPSSETDEMAFRCGLRIVHDACHAPFKKIVENAGKSFELLLSNITDDLNQGYDARNEKFVDMINEGIIDPVKVTRCALEHASSVALTYLSLNAVVYSDLEDQK